MMSALEAMPGPGLVVLLILAAAAGWGLCRFWDRAVDSFYSAGERTRTGARAFRRVIARGLFGIGVLGGLLTLLGLAYAHTH